MINKLNDYEVHCNNLRKAEFKRPNNDFRKHATQDTEANKIFHLNDVRRVSYDKDYTNAQKKNFTLKFIVLTAIIHLTNLSIYYEKRR